MATTLQAVRAEALFVSCLQSSQHPDADAVRDAVAGTLRQHGTRGCAALVAGEYGEHPETAVMRMGWALATVREVLPDAAGRAGRGPAAAAPAAGELTRRAGWRTSTVHSILRGTIYRATK